jgi:small subunit ribosomal protein S17
VPEKQIKELVGYVTSDKMDKTICVTIKNRVLHPVYGKVINKTKKVKAHDEKNEAKLGDKVKVVECRPMSKEKRWRLYSILSTANKA